MAEWEEFAADVADTLGVASSQVRAETRIRDFTRGPMSVEALILRSVAETHSGCLWPNDLFDSTTTVGEVWEWSCIVRPS